MFKDRLAHDPLLFAGTATFYARYRPPCPPSLVDWLVASVPIRDRALDLGCGTGQLSIALASRFDHVVAMDPDEGMLTEARKLIGESRIKNITLALGSSWDLSHALGQFRLVTLVDSFHWMDRDAVLRTLADMLLPGGGVVIVARGLQSAPDYEEAVQTALRLFLGERRRAGSGFYGQPTDRHEEVLARSRLKLSATWNDRSDYIWTVEDVIGYLFSTSYASQRLFGERAADFEEQLRRRLRELSPSGEFVVTVDTSAFLAKMEPQ